MKYKFLSILSTLALIVLTTNSSFATSTTVTSSGNTGAGSLRAALIDSITADTVFFDPMVTTITLSSQITISRDVVIIGNGINKTILSGGNSTRLLASNFEILISSLTMRDGKNDPGEAGAIFCGGTMVIKDVRFANNQAQSNGGAILLRGDMTLINVTLDSNKTTTTTSGRGGAISIRSGTLTMESCLVINNRSEFSGGAISSLNQTSKLFINHSIFQGNSTPNSGGNIVMFGDTVSIANSLITGNKSNTGGGLYLVDVNVGIYNSTIAANRCVQENSSLGRGGGIYVERNTNLYMANTIVGNNTLDNTDNGPDIFFASDGAFIDLGGNLISDNKDINNTAGYISPLIGNAGDPLDPEFVRDVDPSIVPTTTGDFRLRCNSPALDGGMDTLGLTMGVDVAGLPRVYNGTIDIGAHERQLFPPTVVTNTNDDGPGSLRETIALSCPGDTITFDPSTDGDTIFLTSGQIELKSNLVLIGNEMTKTIIDGMDSSRVFWISDADTIWIEGLTIQNGNPGHSQRGGGIYNRNGFLTCMAIQIANNTANLEGGGIYSIRGKVIIEKSFLISNTGRQAGGGIFCTGCALQVKESTIQSNKASSLHGGGISSFSGEIVIEDSRIIDNYAKQAGGGFHNSFGSILTMSNSIIEYNTAHEAGGIYSVAIAIVSNTSITNNSADFAGGIRNTTGSLMEIKSSKIYGNRANGASFNFGGGILNEGMLSIYNSSVAGNRAISNGGGIHINGGTSTIINCTITGNKSDESTGGVYVSVGSVKFTNSIVANNQGATSDIGFSPGDVTIIDGGYNLIGSSVNLAEIFTNNSMMDVDPKFFQSAVPVDLSGNFGDAGDLRLWCTSPAINAGTTDTTELNIGADDILGLPRIIDSRIDIGAHEYFSSQIPTELILSGESEKSFEVGKSIKALVTLEGQNYTFRAEESVELHPIFSVENSATLEVLVDGCVED